MSRIVLIIIVSYFCSYSQQTIPVIGKSDHPRLLLTPSKLSELKNIINSMQTSSLKNNNVIFQMYNEMNSSVNSNYCFSSSKLPVSLWDSLVSENSSGEPIRKYGDALPSIAMVFLIEDYNPVYLSCLKMWLDFFFSKNTWFDVSPIKPDLAGAHLMWGTSVAIDWVYSYLSQSDLGVYLDGILLHLERYVGAINATKPIWWSKSYQQNHNHVNLNGMSAALFLLYGNITDTKYFQINSIIQGIWDLVFRFLPDDGSACGGLSYLSYAQYALLLYLTMEETFLGIDRYHTIKFMEQSMIFRLFGSSSDLLDVADFGDASHSEDYSTIEDWIIEDTILEKNLEILFFSFLETLLCLERDIILTQIHII